MVQEKQPDSGGEGEEQWTDPYQLVTNVRDVFQAFKTGPVVRLHEAAAQHIPRQRIKAATSHSHLLQRPD